MSNDIEKMSKVLDLLSFADLIPNKYKEDKEFTDQIRTILKFFYNSYKSVYKKYTDLLNNGNVKSIYNDDDFDEIIDEVCVIIENSILIKYNDLKNVIFKKLEYWLDKCKDDIVTGYGPGVVSDNDIKKFYDGLKGKFDD